MQAQLNFIRPMAMDPVLDITGEGNGKLNIDPRMVDLLDADAEEPGPSLATHGFGALPFSATLPEGEPGVRFRQQFANRCADVVKKETGAAVVYGAQLSVQVRRSDGTKEAATISMVHTDFTPGSAVRRILELLHAVGKKGRPARMAAYNLWWLARPGPQDRPLALCDATSIAAPDLQVGRAQVLTPERQSVDYGQVALQRYSERHRWYWYPQLAPDRVLVFCGYDSDPSRPSMVTHTAFANPDCPPGTPPRVSVECRCLAIW